MGEDARLKPTERIARSFIEQNRQLPKWLGLLAMLEDYVCTWDAPEGMPKRSADAVYERDGWRCTAPGCSSRRNLEDHHVQYRSHGGGNELANRTCLCRFHHQQGEHGGLASCRGQAPGEVVWRLGCKELGQSYQNERLLQRSDGRLGPDPRGQGVSG